MIGQLICPRHVGEALSLPKLTQLGGSLNVERLHRSGRLRAAPTRCSGSQRRLTFVTRAIVVFPAGRGLTRCRKRSIILSSTLCARHSQRGEAAIELIQDELCDVITASVERLAQEKSPQKLTVRDVLKDLGITNRVFYNRFHSIDEVLAIIYSRSVTQVRRSLAMPWDGHGDFEEHICAVARRTLELTYESRANLSGYIFEADCASPDNFTWWQEEIKKLIRTGKELHWLRSDLDEAVVGYSIWCFIRGFAADAITRKLPKETACQQLDYGFRCLLRGLKP